MNLVELNTILKATGYPVAYSHFVVTSLNPMPAPPFITYIEVFTSNQFADNKVNHKMKNMQIELYTVKKDLTAEVRLEDELDRNEIPYDATETYIESEKLYQRIYETRLI